MLLFLDFFSIQMSSSEFTKALSAVLFFTCGVNCFVQFNNSPKRQIPHTSMHTTARCINALEASKHECTLFIVHIVQVKSTNHCTTSHHCTSTDRSQRTSHTSTHTTVRCVDELIHSKHTNNAMYNAFLTSQTYSMHSAH